MYSFEVGACEGDVVGLGVALGAGVAVGFGVGVAVGFGVALGVGVGFEPDPLVEGSVVLLGVLKSSV
ncbi:hypothetical protein D3C80_2090990 [compost metagenome]